MESDTLARKQYNCNHANIITGTLVEPGRNVSREECTKCEASRPIITITADAPTFSTAARLNTHSKPLTRSD